MNRHRWCLVQQEIIAIAAAVGRVRSLLNAPFHFSIHEEGISFLPIPTIIAIPFNNATKNRPTTWRAAQR